MYQKFKKLLETIQVVISIVFVLITLVMTAIMIFGIMKLGPEIFVLF